MDGQEFSIGRFPSILELTAFFVEHGRSLSEAKALAKAIGDPKKITPEDVDAMTLREQDGLLGLLAIEMPSLAGASPKGVPAVTRWFEINCSL